MIKANNHIRRAARAADVPLWAVALEIGVSEPTLMRWLRIPLTQDREDQIMAAIDHLEKEASYDG